MRRATLALLSVACMVGAQSASAGARVAPLPHPSTFITMRQPISIDGSKVSNRIYATRFCSNKVLAIKATGVVSTYATLPGEATCIARDVAVAPATGGFTKNDVYALEKQTIYKITNNGATVRIFVTIADLENSDTRLSFDTVGTFGFDLIVASRLGKIYRVTAGANVTQIADTGRQAESGQVAPLGWGQFGGQFIATDDFANDIYAISPAGLETHVATYDQPESVAFVPPQVCTFGASGGAYFVLSRGANRIVKFPASDFADLNDGLHALVSTKANKVGLLSLVGGNVVVSDFQVGGVGTDHSEGMFYPCS